MTAIIQQLIRYSLPFFLIFMCNTFNVDAQEHDTTQVNRPFTVFDRFGNEYTSEMAKSESLSSTNLICNAGYYSLYSDYTAGGLTADKEGVLCKVFFDLSEFIIPVSSSIPQIKIRVKDTTSDPSAIGSASSYYLNYQNNPNIVDPVPWHIINGGVDPFSNLIGYELFDEFNYHGFVNINNTFDFHTDLLTEASISI